MSTDDLRALASAADEQSEPKFVAIHPDRIRELCDASDQRDELQRELDAARAEVSRLAEIAKAHYGCAECADPDNYKPGDKGSLCDQLATLRAALDPKPFAERAERFADGYNILPGGLTRSLAAEFAAVAASERERAAKVADVSGHAIAGAIAAAIRALPEPGK